MQDDYQLQGQVAIITGAGRGIGLCIARELGRSGASIVVADIKPELGERAARELASSSIAAVAVPVDVANAASIKTMVTDVMARFGRIDILVNNAGICPYTPFTDVTEKEWNQVLDVNLKGMFLCSRSVFPAMKKQGRGKILNVASMAARTGGRASSVHYTTSKAGVMGITRSMAMHLGQYGVNVNAVAPGVIQTEMTASWIPEAKANVQKQIPLGRLGLPEDVAKVALFLCSRAADYLTGVVLDVTGGLVMS
jgi:3-oxoacyl-[acyl-carrier protein] reductase